ncbi:Tannase/feruloyl esterase [Aspergillus heterothallicus]
MSLSLCTPATFTPLPLYGAQILSTTAGPVSNFSLPAPSGARYTQPSTNLTSASFCNLTITYTHPGRADALTAEIWLPPADDWNERLQTVGGGGWTGGRSALSYANMAGALSDGFAAATTDGGLVPGTGPEIWGLTSPGNLDVDALENFGHRSLGDLAILAKSSIRAYYGRDPLYSYWNGCSNGGRQGSILAQQYPTAYDGIIAAAPASQWPELAMTRAWPSFYMDVTRQYPRACEMKTLVDLAIEVCDGIDGVEDGLISDPEGCRRRFTARDFLGGKATGCDAGRISAAAVNVTQALLDGPRYSNGDFLWFGYEPGTDLSALVVLDEACMGEGAEDGQWCIPASVTDPLSVLSWWRTFVLKDETSSVTTLTHEQYDQLYLALKKILTPVAASEPRITAFQRAGGKMLTFHGLIDNAITPASTLHYFNEVGEVLDDVSGFYRYYRVPGLEHCSGGPGGQPIHLFDQLRAWVEDGTAPGSSSVTVTLPSNETAEQLICPYPQKAVYQKPSGHHSPGVGSWKCK